MRPFVALSLLVFSLVGCSTPYQRKGFTGGFSDSRIDASTFLVEFKGNGATSQQTVQTYLLYRCAELAAEAGYDYFILAGANTGADRLYMTMPGHYSGTTTGSATTFGNTTSGFATTTGTYTPGPVLPVTKFNASAIIKAFHGEKPADNPAAFNAREVLQYLGPTVHR